MDPFFIRRNLLLFFFFSCVFVDWERFCFNWQSVYVNTHINSLLFEQGMFLQYLSLRFFHSKKKKCLKDKRLISYEMNSYEKLRWFFTLIYFRRIDNPPPPPPTLRTKISCSTKNKSCKKKRIFKFSQTFVQLLLNNIFTSCFWILSLNHFCLLQH